MFPAHPLLKFYTSQHTISKSSLSAHTVPQSTYRHTLFPSQPICTPYSPVILSAHPISQSTYWHTPFSSQPVGTPYFRNVQSAQPTRQSCRMTMNTQTDKNRDRGDVTFEFSVPSYRSLVHHQQSTPLI